MASKQQHALDHLIDAAGASVYDEESGCWCSGDDESGFGLSSITNVAKRAAGGVSSVAKRGGRLTYGLAKKQAQLFAKPFEYAYKGVKYVGEKAMQLAMLPIRKVVASFKNKMVSRKARELAAQRRLSAPGPAEKAEALAWAKSYTKSHNSKLGPLVASMMGSPKADLMGCDELDGVANFDEIEGLEKAVFVMGIDDDEMGLAPLVLYPLLALGAVGLMAVLSKLYSSAFAGHPAPEQMNPDAQDPSTAYQDPSAQSYQDPSAQSYQDPSAQSYQDPSTQSYQDQYASQSDYQDQSSYPTE